MDSGAKKTKHLVRAGVLLLVVLMVVFVGLRVMPVPAFLADLGFHSKNIKENEARVRSRCC